MVFVYLIVYGGNVYTHTRIYTYTYTHTYRSWLSSAGGRNVSDFSNEVLRYAYSQKRTKEETLSV